MVRRFVEQKEIGLHHEQPREMSAHDPAAAQGARRAIEIGFAKSESGEDPFRFWLEFPAAVLVKNMERIVISHVVRSGVSDPAPAASCSLITFCACTSSGETARASSSTVSSPAAAVSWGRNPIVAFFSIATVPLSGDASPRISENKVDLPAPLGPTRSDPIATIDLERHVVKERAAGERFREL